MSSHPSAAAGSSQCDLILAALLAANGSWVSILTLHNASGSMAVHSRIADLRARGHHIEHRNERAGRMVHSSYRILAPVSQPSLF